MSILRRGREFLASSPGSARKAGIIEFTRIDPVEALGGLLHGCLPALRECLSRINVSLLVPRLKVCRDQPAKERHWSIVQVAQASSVVLDARCALGRLRPRTATTAGSDRPNSTARQGTQGVIDLDQLP